MTLLSAYCRVSMDKTGAGLGVENQKAEIQKWASDHGHTILNYYVDNDISATTGKNRPAFQQLLTDAPANIVVWHQDRLIRVSKDLEKVLDTKANIFQVVAGSLDLATPSGRAVARTVTAWATYEGEQKAARMKMRYHADAGKGLTFLRRPVFGNNMDGSLDEIEAEAIRAAVADFLKGDITTGGIARRWNDAGLLTPYIRSKKAEEQGLPGRGGNPWSNTTVVQLLKSERLIGKRTYNGQTVELAGWTPVLTEDDWDKVQIHLRSRATGVKGKKASPTYSALLSGFMTCYKCKRPMVVSYSGGKNSKKMYTCASGHLSKSADKTDHVLVDYVLFMVVGPGANAKLNPEHVPGVLEALRAEHAELVEAHKEWIDEAETVGLKPSIIASKEFKHEEAITALEARILEHDKGTLFEGLTIDTSGKNTTDAFIDLDALKAEALERWNNIPISRQRRIIQAIYASVTAYPGKRGQRFDHTKVEAFYTPLGAELLQNTLDQLNATIGVK